MDKYKIYCETEGKWVEVISDTPVTTCPNDAGHTVKADSSAIKDKKVKTNKEGAKTSVSLDNYKTLKMNEFDERTGELILNGGFTYNSKTFSLKHTAQINLLGVDIKKNSGILPVMFNTADNLDTETLNNATDVDNFFGSALLAKKGHLDDGNALKDSVRAAIDEAGVDAVIDNR